MKSKSQGGAQILEFSLLLPFLLMILFLILDLGFLVYNKAVLTNASREAARKGSALSATWSSSAVAQRACDFTKNSLISTRRGTRTATCSGTADPIITVTPLGAVPPNFGDSVTVEIRYAYSGFLTSTTTFLLRVDPWNLVASTTMNHE